MPQVTGRRNYNRRILVRLVILGIVVGVGLFLCLPRVVLGEASFRSAYREARSKADVRAQGAQLWWAGEYYKSDADVGHAHPETLHITAGQEYFANYHGCMSPGPSSFGQVVLRGPGRLLFRPTHASGGASGAHWTASLIRWGDRLYVVSDDRLPAFLKAIETGEEPRDSEEGNFYLRDHDWYKPVVTSPEIPK